MNINHKSNGPTLAGATAATAFRDRALDAGLAEAAGGASAPDLTARVLARASGDDLADMATDSLNASPANRLHSRETRARPGPSWAGRLGWAVAAMLALAAGVYALFFMPNRELPNLTGTLENSADRRVPPPEKEREKKSDTSAESEGDRQPSRVLQQDVVPLPTDSASGLEQGKPSIVDGTVAVVRSKAELELVAKRVVKLTCIGLKDADFDVFSRGIGSEIPNWFPALKELDVSQSELSVVGIGSNFDEPDNLKTLESVKVAPALLLTEGFSDTPLAKYVRTVSLRDDDVKAFQISELARVARLPNVTRLTLYANNSVRDDLVAALTKMQQLEWLDITNCSLVTDKGVATFSGVDEGGSGQPGSKFPKLRSLNLSGTKIGDVALVHLTALKSLESLYIGRTLVTDLGIGQLSRIRTLKHLRLEGCGLVTAEGIRQLGVGVPGATFNSSPLETLEIQNCPKLDAMTLAHIGMKALLTPETPVFASLLRLNLSANSWLDDAALAHLASLTGLNHLDVGNSRVTDAGLKHLVGLKSLKRLVLTTLKVTPSGLEQLAGTGLESLNLHMALGDGTNSRPPEAAWIAVVSRLWPNATVMLPSGVTWKVEKSAEDEIGDIVAKIHGGKAAPEGEKPAPEGDKPTK